MFEGMRYEEVITWLESQTFENIIDELLEEAIFRAEQKGEVIDTREGSIIYDAMAPPAMKIAEMYTVIRRLIDLSFAETSEGEWLVKKAKDFGVDKRVANKALRSATFNIPVGIGERFLVGEIFFSVVSIDPARVECETPGTIGNHPDVGSEMIPINTIDGLQQALLGEVIIPGQEDESDESLLAKLKSKTQQEALSGNKEHYKKWAKEVEGVGKAKVFPLWNGRGTVKVVIVDGQMGPASNELVERVHNYISPVDEMGEGEAPVGATLTVESASILEINIEAYVTLESGKTIVDDAIPEVTPKFELLLKEIAFSKDSGPDEVLLAQARNIIFTASSIKNYGQVLINGVEGDLELNDTQIPRLGTVSLYEQN